MICEISPSIANGKVFAPPSKSMAHRYLICASLSEGESVVKGISLSKDISATINCLKNLGANIRLENDVAFIKGISFNHFTETPILNCNESGSTIRFLIPISLLFGERVQLVGAPSLLARPMDVFKNLSVEHQFFFQQNNYEINVCGPLKSGTYNISGNISSQFITGLLFALPLLKEDSIINIIPPIESYSYLKLTLKALKDFGIEIIEKDFSFYIKGNQKYSSAVCTVEGDYSNAAFLDVFNFIDGNVEVLGLDNFSLQGDRVYKKLFPLLEKENQTIDISDCPDLGPILFALASIKNGATFTGTKRLRIKESDRALTMAEELLKFGVEIKVLENMVIIPKSEIKIPQKALNGHNDHRIVMALSILLSKTGGEIFGCEAVSKSYPNFFETIKDLGIGVKIIETNN